jgi:hypothetical protein
VVGEDELSRAESRPKLVEDGEDRLFFVEICFHRKPSSTERLAQQPTDSG